MTSSKYGHRGQPEPNGWLKSTSVAFPIIMRYSWFAAYPAVVPPSTYKICPVTKFEAAEARYTAAPIMSSVTAAPPIGMRDMKISNSFLFSKTSLVSGVQKIQGAMEFTLMLSLAHSVANCLVSRLIAPLLRSEERRVGKEC